MGSWVNRKFEIAVACIALLMVGSGCGEKSPEEPAPTPGGAGGSAGAPTAGSGQAGSGTAGSGTAGSAGSAGRATSTSGSGGSGTAAGTGGSSAGAGGSGGSNGDSGSGGAGGGAGSAGESGSGGGGSGGNAGRSGNGGRGGMGGSGGSAGGPVIGDGGTVNATITVRSGQTYDGQNKRFRAGSALGDGSQSENQQPVFRIEDGGKLINVVLGAPAADGIHTYGDVMLNNIVWEDIGEDALTIKESGTVVLDGGSASNGEDKVFQINAASTFRISNFTARDAGKFIRQNGDTTFKVEVVIDRCDISNMDEAIFRTDSSTSSLMMTNTRYSNIGDAVFIRNEEPAQFSGSGNTEY